MRNKPVYILWDHAQIWGLMAWRAMNALGFQCRLVKALQIAQGNILGKPYSQNALLLVPGGSARLKASALGQTGLSAIRDWLKSGGAYLGFCGGAGLALATDRKKSLAICPWSRMPFSNRHEHFLSGHVVAARQDGHRLLLPVWWPGRFLPQEGSRPEILASYVEPGEDLWLADKPYKPSHIAHGASSGNDMAFPAGEPLVITGKCQAGRYILSYAHLESPCSPAANGWLAKLLEDYFNLVSPTRGPFDWPLLPGRQVLYDGSESAASFHSDIACFYLKFMKLLELATEHDLLIKRNCWLWGWQTAFPGMILNDMLAALQEIACSERDLEPVSWRNVRGFFNLLGDIFLSRTKEWLEDWIKCRSSDEAQREDAIPLLLKRRDKIFGHVMHGGGLAQRLNAMLYDYIYQRQRQAKDT